MQSNNYNMHQNNFYIPQRNSVQTNQRRHFASSYPGVSAIHNGYYQQNNAYVQHSAPVIGGITGQCPVGPLTHGPFSYQNSR